MNEALNNFYYIFQKAVNFIFNQANILDNVSVGWIAIAIIIFSILIRSILNLPRSMGSFDKFREHTYVSNVTHSDGSKSWSEVRRFRR